MTNKLHKLLDPNISKKEEDQIFEELLKEKFDQDLKTQWKNTLQDEYGITRNQFKIKRSSSKYIRILLATAACISLIVLIQFLTNTSSISAYELAQEYIENQEILHPGASKGMVEGIENKSLAIEAFNTQQYSVAAGYFDKIQIPTEEDNYYHGLALLLDKRYKKAINMFQKGSKESERYKQEINWYLSIAYLLNKENEKAKTQLEYIQSSDWNYQQAQELLKQLE